MNQVRVRITNRAQDPHTYRLSLAEGAPARLLAPTSPLTVPAGEARSAIALVLSPPGTFTGGTQEVAFHVRDDRGGHHLVEWRLMGPGGDR
jgi:hypothetical protein